MYKKRQHFTSLNLFKGPIFFRFLKVLKQIQLFHSSSKKWSLLETPNKPKNNRKKNILLDEANQTE